MNNLWNGNHISAESCMFVIERQSRLLFNAGKILKVENPSTGKVFREGVDYTYTPGTNIIRLTENSAIPFIPHSVAYPTENLRIHPEKNANAIRNAVNGGFLLFNNENFFALNQVEVTYTATENDFNPELDRQSDWLPEVKSKLANRCSLKITLHGDSISEGYNSTKFTGTPPFAPLYMEQVCAALPGEHQFINHSLGGKGINYSRSIREKWIDDKPDLMVIAYGMNNYANTPVADFFEEMDWIISENAKVSPETEYIIVAPMTGNPEWKFTVPGNDRVYGKAFREYVANKAENIALADVQKVWLKLLERKGFFDLTGNGVNHPNDYGHRVYASVVPELLGF